MIKTKNCRSQLLYHGKMMKQNSDFECAIIAEGFPKKKNIMPSKLYKRPKVVRLVHVCTKMKIRPYNSLTDGAQKEECPKARRAHHIKCPHHIYCIAGVTSDQ
jgi:hypothetical protein